MGLWRKSNASLIYSLPFVAHTHSLGLKRMGVVSLGSDSVCTYLCICYRNSTFPPLTCPPLSLYLSSPFLAQATSSKRAIRNFRSAFYILFFCCGLPFALFVFLVTDSVSIFPWWCWSSSFVLLFMFLFVLFLFWLLCLRSCVWPTCVGREGSRWFQVCGWVEECPYVCL